MADEGNQNKDRGLLSVLTGVILGFWRFLRFMFRRFSEDECMGMAASLSYTSLLAVVPMTAIGFAILAAFPAFEGVRERIQDLVFNNFMPSSAANVRDHFDQFVGNAGSMTTVGIIGLTVTAILLLFTIEKAFNVIFRVARQRSVLPRLLVFWALMTLGPVMAGTSLFMSTYFFAVTELVNVQKYAIPIYSEFGRYLLPTVIMIGALTLSYIVIPNRPVSLKAALTGGTIAGLLFSLLRRGFGLFMASVPTYETIYGALAAIPLMLIWGYLCWAVVLFGAVITASYGEWRWSKGNPVGNKPEPGRILFATCHVLALLLDANQRGQGVTRWTLMRELHIGEEALDKLLNYLRKLGLIVHATRGGWVLSRDLASLTLGQLIKDLELHISRPVDMTIDAAWASRLSQALSGVDQAGKDIIKQSIRDLLMDPEARKIIDPPEAPSLKTVS